MDTEQDRGYDDQELLLRAVIAYVCSQINRSEQIISGLMRQSIDEWTERNRVTMKEIRNLGERERLKTMNELIDIFLEKVKHVMESKFQRDRLKTSILQIYEQWKNTRRQPSE
jgi:hypothetical protein